MLIDQEGKPLGKMSRDQAFYLAYEADVDLVQVSNPPAGGPPVVKMMDYGKYRYSQEKLESRQKTKSKAPEIKEIRLSLKIDSHDLDFKVKQAQKFLSAGDKVKVAIKLIGREMMFQEKVKELLENFKTQSGGQFDGSIERMGNRFSAIIKKG